MLTDGEVPIVSSIEGVILIANDFEGQCSFYLDVLGLELSARYSDAAFFKVGSQKLGIFARSHHREGTRRLGDANQAGARKNDYSTQGARRTCLPRQFC